MLTLLNFKVLMLMLHGMFAAHPNDLCSSAAFKNCSSCSVSDSSIYLDGCFEGFSCGDIDSQANTEAKQKFDDFEQELFRLIELKSSVTTLTVRNSPLANFPSIICSLKEISILQIEQSCMKSLPVGCLNKLKTLNKFLFPNNQIENLQRGLFDGLSNLTDIILSNNKIDSVDDDVFSNMTDLLSLTTLDLSFNKLTNVDAWIFIRAVSVDRSTIALRNNKISSITNRKNWFLPCKASLKKRAAFHLDLVKNELKHISDLLIFFPKMVDAACLFGGKYHSPVSIDMDGNAIVCDCVDYPIIKLIKGARYVSFFDGMHCRNPPHLMNRKLFTVPLDEYQCELTPCPDGCYCMEIPHERGIYVNCTSNHLQSLPLFMPTKTKVITSITYNLSFVANSIASIESRSYFNKTLMLDLSFNKIDKLDDRELESLSLIKELHLHSNYLTTVPNYFLQNNTIKPKVISLHNNSWDCSCQNKWLKWWMINLKNKSITLLNPNGILCKTPTRLSDRNIFSIEDVEFCHDPFQMEVNKTLASVLVPVSIILLVAVLLLFIVRKFKVEINAYLKVHPFDRDECRGEHMKFDVFVSCAYSDREQGIELVRMMEVKGYRVCYHEKDFVGGRSIASNIVEAIACSKRVVCLMTVHFINSSYCMFEFRTSLQRNVQLKRERLIAILDDSLRVDKATLPNDVYQFLTSHTYIEFSTSNKWINQLFYNLPIHSSENNLQQVPLGMSTDDDILLSV